MSELQPVEQKTTEAEENQLNEPDSNIVSQEIIKKEGPQNEVSLIIKRSQIVALNKENLAKAQHVKVYEQLIEKENQCFDEFLGRSRKKSVEAKRRFEEECKRKREMNAAIEKLNDEIWVVSSECTRTHDTLNKYERYKNLLFKLSPEEWQEDEVLSDAADEQNKESQSAGGQGLEFEESSPGSTREPQMSSAHSDTVAHSVVSSPVPQENLHLFFSDTQQLLDLVMDLTDQNLSLIQNSTRGDETREELLQTIETTRVKMKEDEEKLTLQITDMKERIDTEKERSAKLELKVQLHVSLKAEDKDVMLDDLGDKVTEVHCRVLDSRMSSLSTLEKLSSIEYRMSVLLQNIESIPEESLEAFRQLKDSERRTRQQEEKLRLEKEKQRERMKKCMERSMGDAKKIRGRKLLPRCIPVEQKIKVSVEDNVPAEDELHTYLFTTDNTQ
ncbi:cilia- and flagella-associated protein 100-like [Scomber japonicus]|uniref:cilia- and flagella-associated protein 100-like n=1 Tax=Scomber japonicus TaxID=13676 RepID=UPI002304D222|nr:cilia- and flagella-associated protein 100-like [Scomber japonicus]